jgi:hypothetical protein
MGHSFRFSRVGENACKNASNLVKKFGCNTRTILGRHDDEGKIIESKLFVKMVLGAVRTRMHSVPTVDSILQWQPWSSHDHQHNPTDFRGNDRCLPFDCSPILPSSPNPAHNLFTSITHPATKPIKTTVGTLCIRVLPASTTILPPQDQSSFPNNLDLLR